MKDDALDRMLRQAFAADRAHTPRVDISAQVMPRIRRAARVRGAVLAVAALAGLLILLAQVADPALIRLAGAFTPQLEGLALGEAELLTVFAVLAFSAWTMLSADPSL
jgi:hypothetical protein